MSVESRTLRLKLFSSLVDISLREDPEEEDEDEEEHDDGEEDEDQNEGYSE